MEIEVQGKRGKGRRPDRRRLFLVIESKQPIMPIGLAKEWFRQLFFSSLECGVHDRLPIVACVGY